MMLAGVRRWLVFVLATIVGAYVLIGALLFVYQGRMIYHPRPAHGCPGALPVEATTIDGRQHGWWVPPRSGSCARMWLVFGGNATLAEDMHDLIVGYPDADAGFLLVDYPGYGYSAGSPSPASIDRATDALLSVVRSRWVANEIPLSVVGHSLGAAVALRFGTRHQVAKVVLLAPCTSMLDMARLSVGWPLCHVLRHRFDNRRALQELISRPRLHVLHGTDDEVIPVAMGAELARVSGAKWIAIPGGDHNGVLTSSRRLIWEQMRAP